MTFGVYKVIITDLDGTNRREVYEYGEDEIEAIEEAIKKHSFPMLKVRVVAKKLGNAIELLEAVGHYR